MRICHVIDNVFLDRGGPVAVVTALGQKQLEMGHEVSVACRSISRSKEERQMLRSMIGDGVRLISTEEVQGGLAASLNRIRPDILHLHAIWEPILRQAAAWGRVHRVPWVTSTHGLLHPNAMRKGFLKKQVYLRLLGTFVKESRRVLTLNREESSYVGRLLGADTVIMPNGVDIVAIRSAEPAAFYHAFPSVPLAPFILAMGRVHPVKGFDLLVRAYAAARRHAELPDLVIVGPMDGGEAAVLATADRYRIRPHVHLPGAAFGALRFSAINACVMFAHRPRYEGFGMVVAEALAAGRPVVTTRATGLAREVPEGILRVAADSDEDFGAAMATTILDSIASNHMASRAATWSRDTLSWDQLVQQQDVWYRNSSASDDC